jgi:hypothetical protein
MVFMPIEFSRNAMIVKVEGCFFSLEIIGHYSLGN